MPIHWVFVAKYRRKIVFQEAIEKLRRYFARVCTNVEWVEMGAEGDNLYLASQLPAKVSGIPFAQPPQMGCLGGQPLSPRMAAQYDDKGVLWVPSGLASRCGDVPISIIRQYIEQQQTPR